MDSVQAAPPQKRRWRPRISLRALFCLVLLLAAAGSLWHRWEPWGRVAAMELELDGGYSVHPSADLHWFGIHDAQSRFRVLDLSTRPIREVLRRGDVQAGHNTTFHGNRLRVFCRNNDGEERFDIIDLPSGQVSFSQTNANVFEPSADGSLVAYSVSSAPLTAVVYDLNQRRQVAALDHAAVIEDFHLERAVFSSDNQRLTVFSPGHLVQWNLADASVLRKSPLRGDFGVGIVGPAAVWFVYSGEKGFDAVNLETGAATGMATMLKDSTALPSGNAVFLSPTRVIVGDISAVSVVWDLESNSVSRLQDLKLLPFSRFSADGRNQRFCADVQDQFAQVAVIDSVALEPLYRFPDSRIPGTTSISSGSDTILQINHAFDARIGATLPGTLELYTRRRPEQWWGLAWLPESWLALLLFVALLLCLRADWKAHA